MSRSSRESSLTQYREALLQLNSQFFQILSERRATSLRIQELKDLSGRYSNFDPDREKVLFEQMSPELSELTLKELLAFSLVMEDQAMAMAPGSYPTWSNSVHLNEPGRELVNMINPILLKITHPELFNRLSFSGDFVFLKQF